MIRKISLLIAALLFLSGGIVLLGFVGKANDSLAVQSEKTKNTNTLQEGDIIFQSSMSGQSYAIQLATNSKYSHCGILLKNKKGELQVLEAIQPVVFTPIDEFIRRGDDNHYMVKRLNNRDEVITEEVLKEMHQVGKSFVGKDYDIKFLWSDDKMYCSELVWKIYERSTGIKLGEPQPLKSYSLDSKVVKQKMEERYGKDIPWVEPMVAPSTVFDAEMLEVVVEK